MKRLALVALTLTVAISAADFWTKPFAEWNDKELQSMLTKSPWADRFSVETGQRGMIGNADDKGGPIQGNLSTPITVSWATALPVKQAVTRLQPSPQSQQMLDRVETSYVVRVTGFPGLVRGAAQDTAKLTEDTALKVKGKPDLHPSDIQISGIAGGRSQGASKGNQGPPTSAEPEAPAGRGGRGGGGRNSGPAVPEVGGGGFGGRGGGAPFEAFFIFPKTSPFSLDDKEVEFNTKVGPMVIRRKFKLKDMVYNGKLEM